MENIEAKIRPYQVEDVEWLKTHPRSILGSEMGVGKTLEILKLAKDENFDSILVMCPKSLVLEWEDQIKLWLGEEWLDHFVILNYEKIRNNTELVKAINRENWDMIAYDECHRLKNIAAQQTKGATKIALYNISGRLHLISGTPQQNGPQDLFSLLHMIEPQNFDQYWNFVREFCYIVRLPKPPFPIIIQGALKSKEPELRALLHARMLRREKRGPNGVLNDLPPISTRTIPVELNPAQRAKYIQMEDDLFTILDSGEKIMASAVTAQLVRLRQLCLEPNLLSTENKVSSPSTKTSLIIDLIRDSEDPVVVFTYFEKYARVLEQELQKVNIPYALYVGTIKDENVRHQTRVDFQAGMYKALICTITTAGLGLTLTRSHTVIFSDWYYNPMVNNQARDRLDRLGQTKPITVIDLWAHDTIEDAVHRILRRKQRSFDAIVSNAGTEMEVRQETLEQLREMRKQRRTN